jgi:hypothetical protein
MVTNFQRHLRATVIACERAREEYGPILQDEVEDIFIELAERETR